jgi:hypothetical protein
MVLHVDCKSSRSDATCAAFREAARDNPWDLLHAEEVSSSDYKRLE